MGSKIGWGVCQKASSMVDNAVSAARAPSAWPPMPSITTRSTACSAAATATRSWFSSRWPMRLTSAVSICNACSSSAKLAGHRLWPILAATPMIRSMTGFARCERQFPWGLLAWEMKTVNHRFLELGCRLPEEFRAAESDFRAIVAAAIRRGKVECGLHFRPAVVAAQIEVDSELLASLTSRAQQIAVQAGTGARIDVLDLLRWPGVIRDGSRDTAPMIAAAKTLLEEALTELARFRDSEGGRLREALELRCAGLLEFSGRVTERLPEIRSRMRAKL